jgi:hypothetical protein
MITEKIKLYEQKRKEAEKLINALYKKYGVFPNKNSFFEHGKGQILVPQSIAAEIKAINQNLKTFYPFQN